MYSILTTIKKCLTGWEPSNIFYTSRFNEVFVITKYYTKLGKWFEDAPNIVVLLKIFWYIPVWVVYIVFTIFWFIIELFLPSSVKAWL